MFQVAGFSKGPKLLIKKKEYNWGEVSQGKKVTHAYSVKNTGDKKLIIERIKPACGCTAGKITKKEIAPGDTASFLITFNTKGYSGDVSKSAKVYSNDSKNPTQQIIIKGKVIVDLTLSNQSLYLNAKYDKTPRIVKLTNTSSKDIKILSALSDKLEVVLLNPIRAGAPITLKPNENYEFKIKGEPSLFSTEKKTTGSVKIKTNSQLNPELNIRVAIVNP